MSLEIVWCAVLQREGADDLAKVMLPVISISPTDGVKGCPVYKSHTACPAQASLSNSALLRILRANVKRLWMNRNPTIPKKEEEKKIKFHKSSVPDPWKICETLKYIRVECNNGNFSAPAFFHSRGPLPFTAWWPCMRGAIPTCRGKDGLP